MMRDGGTGMVYFPLLNYANGNLDFLEGALFSDDRVNCHRRRRSLRDHRDAAATTFMLQHWSGTETERVCHWSMRSNGSATIPRAVWFRGSRQIGAWLVGRPQCDRYGGAVSKFATVAFDLPAGGRRLLQTAEGYEVTIKSGRVTFRQGVKTGDYPGRGSGSSASAGGDQPPRDCQRFTIRQNSSAVLHAS